MSGQYCYLCKQTLELNRAVVLPSCEHGEFHFDCIVNLFADKLCSSQPINCPVCGLQAPNIMAPTWIPIRLLMLSPLRAVLAPKKKVLNATFQDVWPQVWAKLKLARDAEAKFILVDAPKPDVAPDVTRKDLYPFREQTNFREMVSSCWICKQLLGNLLWTKLGSCGHFFHVQCIATTFLDDLKRILGTAGQQYTEDLECPLCCKPASVGYPSLNSSLTTTINHHFREVSKDVIPYCINFLVEKETPSPAKP